MTLFGHQGNDFNRNVSEWNQQIRGRETRKGQLEERERLRPDYHRAVELMEHHLVHVGQALRFEPPAGPGKDLARELLL